MEIPIEHELDHIGIAVNSISEGQKFYQDLCLSVSHVEKVESEKVLVAMLELSNHCRIELLEPLSSESPIAKFIAKKGIGIHHICIRVKNIDHQLMILKQKGYKLINEVPKKGAHNCKVAFVHPASSGGVLIELSEPLKE